MPKITLLSDERSGQALGEANQRLGSVPLQSLGNHSSTGHIPYLLPVPGDVFDSCSQPAHNKTLLLTLGGQGAKHDLLDKPLAKDKDENVQ